MIVIQCGCVDYDFLFPDFFCPLSSAAPPMVRVQCPPPPLSRATGHGANMLGTSEPLCWGHRSIGAGPRHETSGDHRLVPGSAHYPPGRRPATVSQQIFLVRYRKYFSCCSPSHGERVPASSSHQIFNIQFVILNITLCFPSTHTTKMSLFSPYSSVKLQRDS